MQQVRHKRLAVDGATERERRTPDRLEVLRQLRLGLDQQRAQSISELEERVIRGIELGVAEVAAASN